MKKFLVGMIVVCFANQIVYGGECNDPKTSQQIAQCVGKELRAADAQINESYQALMKRLDESDRLVLRLTQRSWIEARDKICELDTKETNRDRWYQALLEDYPKTVCVTKFTRKRIKELKAMLAQGSPVLMPQASASTTSTSQTDTGKAYDGGERRPHSSGKWYYELTVDYPAALDIEPIILYAGAKAKERKKLIGVMYDVSERERFRGIVTFGFAIDLDNGRLYYSRNGEWLNGEPGSNQGKHLKLGEKYYAAFGVSADNIDRFFKKGAIVPRLGDGPMKYSLPSGYYRWRDPVPDPLVLPRPKPIDRITSIPTDGYKASYFEDGKFVASEIVDSIDIRYKNNNFKDIHGDQFNAIWERIIQVKKDKDFLLSSGNSWSVIRIYIDGILFTEWRDRQRKVPIHLSKGSHTFKLEYYNNWESVGFHASFKEYPGLVLSDKNKTLKKLIRGKATTVYLETYSPQDKSNRIFVKMGRSKYPVILFLSSYEGARWKIENPYHIPIKAVVLHSFSFGSEVSVRGSMAKVFNIQKFPSNYSRGGLGRQASTIEKITGVAPSFVFQEYSPLKIVVPDL